MSSQDRRAREKAAVHEKILSAARELFARDGVEAVTMRRIAGAIDYTPAALYVHFKDKQDLLRALCRHDFAALQAQSMRMASVSDPIERIRRVGLGLVSFAAEHPNHYRFMFMTQACLIEPAPEDLARIGNPEHDGYAFFVKLVEEAIAAGRFHPYLTDAHLVAQTLWAGIHGVIALHLTYADDPWVQLRPLEHRARVMVDTQLEGMTRKADGVLAAAGEAKGKRRTRAVKAGAVS